MLAVAAVSCTTPAASTTPAPPAPVQTPGQPRALFVRPCESEVSGALAGGWRTGQITAGPIVFVGARGYANDRPGRFAASAQRARVQKVLVVIAGHDPVELSVEVPEAALFYDPARWRDRNVVPFRLGDARVRFEPCPTGRTQFNGGFLLRRAACVPVEVRPASGEPMVATISFGAGRCT